MLHFESGIKEILENPKSPFYILTPEEKEELQDSISLTSYRRNEYIFREGDKPSGFMMLVTGKVKIFKEGVGGREQIIRMSKPMGIIGYRAFFADENHIATAVTLEDSVIANISMEFIMHRAVKNSEFSLRLIRKLARELGFANLRTVTLTQKHIRGRLAESLILLAEKYGFEHDGTTLKVYMSREDIANLSNMTTSNAIRTLSTFANEKLITIDGRKIKILDLQRLDRISKLG
ncbi:MAG: Crp/Fnr family transcriptional regulator [Prolixibacteraceae bacterium]|jgi:CRP-like cAMP-binding protein|nr:Crp/Fnr family transcriptional regulator [Prolixibacteraceae bacterium]NLX28771.1 Crp/Fnr family transcriptional regulator [Bacteroidales bacterium]HOY52408.1 Crp/Fnr family transcriptional regulator [Prolixibacteraceae bacterium]HPJ79495.1 Crp/Fnr family transcriptional regulator [Prolixibacteraceae bacterium]HRV90130.1 Crp/Fnr family transcriptional regulator [Prolixibacteraceae bacterium]